MRIDSTRLLDSFLKRPWLLSHWRAHGLALGVALAYLALAGTWVLLTGELATRVTPDGALVPQPYPTKALALVAMTAALVYVGAWCAVRRLSGREALLRRREMQLSGIIDTAMDAIITVDAAQKIVVFNRAASQVFGLPAEQAMGRPLEVFVPQRLQAAHRAHVQRYAQSGKTARDMRQLHTLIGLRANGAEFPMEAAISRLGEGDAVLMTVVLRDTTDRQLAEKAREAQAAAEAASRAKTQFLAQTSHELRTPLNAVLGFSHLLLLGQPGESLGEAQRRQVELVRDAGWHLLALVNDVLDVSRIESGALRVNCRSVRLPRLLDEAWSLAREQAQQHGVSLHADYRDAPPVAAWCDPLRLRQVVLNLLSNAIKYNRPGGHVRVELAAHEPAGPSQGFMPERAARRDSSERGDTLVLRVVDSGLGMTAKQLAHLYEPFNRLGRDRGGVEGSGLGLAVTRDLLRLMNGELHIDSAPGVGTTVEVLLPRCELPPEPAGFDSATTEPAPLDDAVDSPPRLPIVLYVEDNPVNMLLVEQLLQRWPLATLAQASDGESGLALARRLRPDLVLLDMRLPDMEGVQWLQSLRDDPHTAALRVVALSASAMPEEIARAREAGAIGYWTKPLDFEQFPRDLRALLATRSEQRAWPA